VDRKHFGVGAGIAVVAAALFVLLPLQASAGTANAYTVTPLVSDQAGVAAHQDPLLVNAWGLTASSTSPWWISANETSVSTIYNGSGATVRPPVTVGSDQGPTGVVFNGSSSFQLAPGAPARFIFATESGGIWGWNPSVAPNDAVLTPAQPLPGFDPVYKGLAIAAGQLYAADFHNDVVDVYNGSWQLVNAFTDPKLPTGFAPFGIQAIGGNLFVTFAKQDADRHDDVAGPGLGYVDEFGTDGHLIARVAMRGMLNSPWGLALAPAGFGSFGGDLLVGNFGDGRITAFHRWPTGIWTPAGQLRDSATGNPIVIDGLWALQFGNNGLAGPAGTLFFTAGPDGESHGLFGSITSG
jgi:uncharacterized protein (TIGR03118 family)